MKYEKIEAKTREARGSRAARGLRREGQVPGVIYGGLDSEGKPRNETVSVAMDRRAIERHVKSGVKFYDLSLDGGAEVNTVIKELQFDAFDDAILHIDFERIDLNRPVAVTVPLELRGTPEGVKVGGRMRTHNSQMKIRGLPRALPESILVTIDHVGANESLRMGQVQLPEGVECASRKEIPVVEVKLKVVKAAAPEDDKKKK